jgi:hypothetical protein
MKLDQITLAEANAILDGRHYLGPVQFPPRYCIATPERDAVAVYSWPMAASFKVKFAYPLEIARLWRAEGATVRTDKFLHRSVQMVAQLSPRTDVVFTYADPAQGHTGKVYKGAGFTRLQEQTRVTDEWVTGTGEHLSSGMVYRQLKTKSRKAIEVLQPDWQCVPGAAKILFAYPMRMTIEEVQAMIAEPLPDDRRKLFSKAYGGFRVAVYQERFPARKCIYCHRLFIASRADAKTCSASCRTMLSRTKQARQ